MGELAVLVIRSATSAYANLRTRECRNDAARLDEILFYKFGFHIEIFTGCDFVSGRRF
jgi:hypothetical protein